MILPSGGVQHPIINRYPPSELDSCGNEFAVVVLDHDYPSLFSNDLDGAYLLTSRDGVNNVMI